MVEVSEDM